MPVTVSVQGAAACVGYVLPVGIDLEAVVAEKGMVKGTAAR